MEGDPTDGHVVSLDAACGPDGLRIFAIGDVHGCSGLLERMHALIEGDLRADPPADWRIIYLGDYGDRGPDTRGVLSQLAARMDDPRYIMLQGNHDAALLHFLRSGELTPVFAMHGGEETLRSYGVDAALDAAMHDDDLRRAAHMALGAAVPQAHVKALAQLQPAASFGDYFFCHAGVRPDAPLSEQTTHDLVWIREPFLSWPGLLPKVIVHGHTPRREPVLRPHRICVDTAAVNTGRLTALVIEGPERRFLFASQ